MATKVNAIKLQQVRNDWKKVTGTISHVINVIYSEYDNLGGDITKVLPRTKKEAGRYGKAICNAYRVGQYCTRYKRNEAGEIVGGKPYTIQPSVDMVLRYFVAKYNEAVPEDKVAIK